MTTLMCFISFFVLINVKYLAHAQSADVESTQLAIFSTPSILNISSHDAADVVQGYGTSLDASMVSEIFSDILDSPVVKLVSRVYELHRAQTEPIEIISAVLRSAERSQLIDDWLTWSDVTSDVNTAVQSLVSSPELITVIEVLTYNNSISISKELCSVHNFTKMPEFRQLFDIITSLAANTTISQLESVLGKLTGVLDTLKDRLQDIFNWNKASFVELVFSPAIDTFLDIYCDLDRRASMPDTNGELTDKATQQVDFDPSMTNVQSDGTDSISNITSTINIDQLINQVQTSITSSNRTELTQILSQLQNGSLGNETVAIREFIEDLVQQVNNSLVTVLNFIHLFIEKFIHEILKKNGISTSCRESSFVFLRAFLAGERWTLKVVDAMGKLPRDLSDAGTLWLGNFDECTAVPGSSIDGYEPFDGKYCRATIPNPGLKVLYGSKLTLGTCVPSTCSATDTFGLLLTVQTLLLDGSTPIVPSIYCVEDVNFGTDAVIVTCILVIILFIVVCGTLYDVVFIQAKSRRTGSKDGTSGTRDSLSSTTSTSSSSNNQGCLCKPIQTAMRTSPRFKNGDEQLRHEQIKLSEKDNNEYRTVNESGNIAFNILDSEEDKDHQGAMERVMLSFSAYTNAVKLLSSEQPNGTFGAIYGIRFFSMAWIIFGHTFYFARGYHDDIPTQYDEQTNYLMFSIVMYATPSVDSFFAISGILLGYLTFRQLEKVGGAKHMNWVRFYFHRYWRLTPSYMLILMTATVLLSYTTTGPMWQEDFPGTQGCRKYWWTNLLYINNFVNIYPDTNMCALWTWYLANDMQFYILSPLIILPLFYNVMAGIVSCVVFLAATITTTAVLVHKYEYSAQTANLAYSPTPKDDYILQRIYFPCYTRMGPYIIGLMTGYLLYRLKSTCRIPKTLNLLCWFVCLAICCLCVFGPYSYKDDHIFTQLQSDAFLALHKTGWGIAICWIVFACATGNGGWINDLLSWRPFIPLGKLTYAAYLVHPIVIYMFYASRRFPANFTDYALYLFVGHVVLSYGAAFVTCLMFETPMIRLEKVIFGNHRK